MSAVTTRRGVRRPRKNEEGFGNIPICQARLADLTSPSPAVSSPASCSPSRLAIPLHEPQLPSLSSHSLPAVQKESNQEDRKRWERRYYTVDVSR